MSSPVDPRHATGAPRHTEQPSPAPEPSTERALLEKVLQQTLTQNAADALAPADLEALRAVARRYQGQPLEPDPIGVELVEIMLRSHFPKGRDASAWIAMCSRIAQTLFDDPVCRDRLQAFWGRLCETSR